MTGKYKTVELTFEKPIVIMRFTGKTPTAEMLLPDRQIRLGHTFVGVEHQQQCVCARHPLTCQLRLSGKSR